MSREALAELALLNAELHAQRDAAARQAEAYKQRADAAERQRDELREKYETEPDPEPVAAPTSAPRARKSTGRKSSARKRG
jgi:hypothetical protein